MNYQDRWHKLPKKRFLLRLCFAKEQAILVLLKLLQGVALFPFPLLYPQELDPDRIWTQAEVLILESVRNFYPKLPLFPMGGRHPSQLLDGSQELFVFFREWLLLCKV